MEGEFEDGQKKGTWRYWEPDGAPTGEERGAHGANGFGPER